MSCYAGCRLTGRCRLGNALDAAGDDMSATVHFRLRLVEVSGIEGQESPSLSVSAQAPSMYCLPPASMLTAVHFAFMLSSTF